MTKTKRWKPTQFDTYHFVCIDGFVDIKMYVRTSGFDKDLISFGNCFKTKKEALAAAKRVRAALKGENDNPTAYSKGYVDGVREEYNLHKKSKCCETQLPKNWGKLK